MPKKKVKKKRGRPVGGQYPEPIREAWREYKRAQREAERDSKRVLNMIKKKAKEGSRR